MNIKLPIESVESLVEIVLGERIEVSYRKEVIDSSPEITYTISVEPQQTTWKIYIHPMGASTDITFPMHALDFMVQRSHLGTMHIYKIDPQIQDICRLIHKRLQLEERESLRNDPSRTQPSNGEGVTALTETQEGARSGSSVSLPANIKHEKIDSLVFGESCKKGYRDFSEDLARDILRNVPVARQAYGDEAFPGSWGPRFIAKILYKRDPGVISNHLRVLYRLGVRSVDKIKLPYRPRNSHN